MNVTRRDVLFSSFFAFDAAVANRAAHAAGPIDAVVAGFEHRLSARIGWAVVDEATGATSSGRGDERFALTSTFKVSAVAALLRRVDEGADGLDRRVVFGADALVAWSPVTEARVGPPGMTLAEIAEAALQVSDNTAGNLLLDAIGGPAGFTAFLRTIGDEVTRLDRRETELGTAIPGDPRDTTTPLAAVATLRRLILGDALSAGSRARLRAWMIGDRVGGPLLRAGMPADWIIADKTGAGGNGARAIVAVVEPPGRAPLTVAIFVAETAASMDDRNAAIAEIGRAIAAAVRR